MVVGGLTVLVVLVLMLPVKPAYVTDRGHVDMLNRQANLRGVWGFVAAFPDETDDGRFPEADRYGELLLEQFEVMPSPLFGPEDTQDDIWIIPIPWPDRRIPEDITQEELAQIPLLHERVDLNPDGTSVAFWDGSVRFLTNEEFEAIINVEQSVCLACEFAVPELMKRREP
tara:strand:- start:84 stop:596 length:513 start_codon:yes stop_codon:yes gene_type:complete